MKNRILKTALVLSTFVLAFACSTDDHTGDTTQTPSNPSLSVTLGFANTQTLIEQDISFPFTVSISEPQIVSVVVYLSQTGGTATNGEDFDIPASVTILPGSTSASGTIDIHADDLVEDTETAVITIGTGNESNVQTTSQTVTFNIANLVEGDLQVGLVWDTNVVATDGSDFDPTDLADLRLLITTAPNNNAIFIEEDGGSFESGTLSSTDPDGDYYVVADWYAAADLGDQGTFPVDLTASFDQVGVINGLSLNFANALESGSACSAYFVLAKITKTGSNYDVTNVGENSPAAAPFIGTATILADDWADYSVGDSIEVEADPSDPNAFFIRAYTNPYISNGATAYMIVTVDPATNTASVMSNEVFDYGCSDGTVTGSGSVNPCTGTIDLILDFNLGNCGDYTGNAFTLQL